MTYPVLKVPLNPNQPTSWGEWVPDFKSCNAEAAGDKWSANKWNRKQIGVWQLERMSRMMRVQGSYPTIGYTSVEVWNVGECVYCNICVMQAEDADDRMSKPKASKKSSSAATKEKKPRKYVIRILQLSLSDIYQQCADTNWTRMWANAQRDGHPAEYRWRPLFNAPKFGWRPLLECHAVTLPRRKTRWNLQWCLKLTNRSQPLVGWSSPYSEDM